MAPLLYLATAILFLFLARRAGRLSPMTAAVLLLLPLCLTGRALFTGAVYGPLDLAFAGEPLVAIGDRVGVRDVVNPSISDVYTEFFPWNDALRRSIARRQWPLWNPYELCGTPLAGAAQAAPYHPVTVIGYLVPLRNYFAFAATLLYFTAALSAYILLRDLVESELAALIGAAGWMFSTHLIFFAGTALAHAVAVTPLVLFGARRIVRMPGLGSAAVLTTSLVLVVLAGHPESALHIVSFAVIYTVYQIVVARPVRWRPLLAAGVGSGITALLLTAFFLLPHLEAIGQSEEYVHRALGYRHNVSSTEQMLHRLRANAMPFLEGAPGVDEVPHSRAVAHGWLATAYGGSLLLALALAGVLTRSTRERWFFAGTVVIALAIGIGAPGITQFLASLPGFDIAVNDRMIVFATLGLCALAAGGVDAWLRSQTRFCWAVLFGVAVALVLMTAVTPTSLSRDYVWLGAMRAVLPLLLAGAALLLLPRQIAATALVALLLIQRVGETSRIQPTVPGRAFYPPFPGVELMQSPEPFRIVALGTLLAPAISTHYGLEDVRGFQAVTFARYDATYPLWSVRQPVWFNRVDTLSSPFLSLMNVRFALVPARAEIPSWWMRRGQFESYDVVENRRVLPRAFLPASVRLVGSPDESLRGITDVSDFGEQSWIEVPGRRGITANGSGSVAIQRDGGLLQLMVRVNAPAWVVVSNGAWNGWTARMAGRNLPLHFANHAFLAFEVPAGDHMVELRYLPRSFVIGSAVSGGTALLILAFLAMRTFRART
jgi:hypothetical protein